jgi:hypothetical protein
VQLQDNSTLNIYDKDSNELGHGGPPFLGRFGEEIYHKDNITISAYPMYGEGPSLLGSLGIALRGQKEFTTQSGDIYYVNNTITGIPGDDPRIIYPNHIKFR